MQLENNLSSINTQSSIKTGNASFDKGFELGQRMISTDLIQCFASKGLSTEEVQFLVKYLSTELNELQEFKKILKEEKSMMWSICNKEDPDSQMHFDTFSKMQSLYKTLKRNHNKLSKIQYKLKQFLSKSIY